MNATYAHASNFGKGNQIVNIYGSLDKFTQYLCNEVLINGFRSHFHSAIQHPASKKSMKIRPLVLITFGRVIRLSILMSH